MKVALALLLAGVLLFSGCTFPGQQDLAGELEGEAAGDQALESELGSMLEEPEGGELENQQLENELLTQTP